LHHVDVDSTADVSEVFAASIFKAEVCVHVYIGFISTGGRVNFSAWYRHNRDNRQGNVIKNSPSKGHQVYQNITGNRCSHAMLLNQLCCGSNSVEGGRGIPLG
jgi:hypothetical protein